MRNDSLLRVWALTASGTIVAFAAILVGCVVADASSVEPDCDGSLQALVDNAAPGDVVEAQGGCVYREEVEIDKSLTLRAAPDGTQIRGSEIWDDAAWSQQGATWISSKAVPILATDGNWRCETDTARCRWPEQVFIDGRPLAQVAVGATPGAGQFARTANRRIVLGENPIGKAVEVTERDNWVSGGAEADGVTIDGFSMKHAASDGIVNAANDNWTVQNGDFSYSHTSNLKLSQATELLALDNKIHHGGQKGVTGNQSDLTLRDNEIYENNTEDFKAFWNAGGVKIGNPQTVTFDGNTVYNNHGNGLWLDVPTDNQLLVVKNNRVHHNDASGIRSEVANDAQIHDNVVWENGFGTPGTGHAGILLNASSRNRVHDNVVAWNENGILVRNPLRTDVNADEIDYDYVNDVEVDHNNILQAELGPDEHFALAWEKAWDGGNIHDPAAGNHGHDNRYWYPGPEDQKARYAWDAALTSIGAFNDTPGEEVGRYLSAAEKDEVVATSEIPASPPDATAPTTTATLSPAPNAEGWNKDDTTVALSAADEAGGSGVKQITYSAAGAQQTASTVVQGDSVQVPVTAEGQTTISFSAGDNFGNVEADKTLTVKLDTTGPTVECAAADDRWHGADVSIDCTATDDASGLADEANDAALSLSTDVADGTETASAQTGSRQITDRAGNTATAGPISGNRIDKKVPEITISTPAEGAEYRLDQAVAAGYSCSDGGSGVAGCSGPVASGANIDTATPGTRSFAVTATDNAGNTNSATHAYAVVEEGPTAGCTVVGSANGETLTGTTGNDVVCGLGGDDTLKGLGGNDTLRGDDGADKLLGGKGDDGLDGGAGTDVANFSGSSAAVTASLAAGSATGEGSDRLAGVENLIGSKLADSLSGSVGGNSIDGKDGNDTLRGGSGDDSAVGGVGGDKLFGEAGDDSLNSRDGVRGNDSLDGGTHVNGDTKVTDATEKSIVGFP